MKSRLFVKKGDHIYVKGHKSAIVMLMTDVEYDNYESGRGSFFYGGFFADFPANIEIPFDGYWNIIIYSNSQHTNVLEYLVGIVENFPY